METPKKGGCGCGCLTLIIIVIGIGLLFHSGSDSNSGAKPTPSDSKSTPETSENKRAEPSLSPDQMMDADALDASYETAADVFCGSGANDYLRSVAKYEFKWDNVAIFDTKFDQYSKRVSAPGVLTLVTHKAMLQNGFGAYGRTTLMCDYDTQSKTVLRYRIIADE
jgi:hypothetical protein